MERFLSFKGHWMVQGKAELDKLAELTELKSELAFNSALVSIMHSGEP